MGPLAVDPEALYAAGSALSGAGGGLQANLTVLSAGFAAHTGLDAAGMVFGLQYQAAGESLLTAAAALINACGQSGAKIQQGAANYSNVEAASNVRGGAGVLPAPPEPPTVSPPAPPGTWGKGEPPPLLWAVVQSFLDDVWPDGDVAGLHAAADRWRGFGAAVGGVRGSLDAAKTLLDGQQIPEGGKIDEALSHIGDSAATLLKGCMALARTLDNFANDVENAQNSIRDLLNRLGSLTDLGHDLMLIVKGDALDEIKKVVNDIEGVLHNLGREARAMEQSMKVGAQLVDGAVVKLEKYVRGELKQYLGDAVGNQLATAFDVFANANAGAFKTAVGLVQTLGDFDPRWFLVDPDGAAATWTNTAKGLWKGSLINAFFNPREATQAQLQQLKSLLHLQDWSWARPGYGFGENAFDVATAIIPGAGEVGIGADGARAAARGGEVAADAAGEEAAAGGGAAGGIAGALGPRGALADIAGTGTKLTKDLEGVTGNLPKIEPPPVGGQPVGLPPGKLPDAPVGPAPHAPDGVPGAPHEPTSAPAPASAEPPAAPGGQPAHAPAGGPHEPGGGPPASTPTPPGGPHEPPTGLAPAPTGGPHEPPPEPAAGAPAPASPPGGPHEPGVEAPAPAQAGATSGGPHGPGSVPMSHAPEPALPSGGGAHEPGVEAPAPAQAGATGGGPHDAGSVPGERPHELAPEPAGGPREPGFEPESAPAEAGPTSGGRHDVDSLPGDRPHELASEPAGGPREPVSVPAGAAHEPASVPAGGSHEPVPAAPPVAASAAMPASVGDRLPSAVPTAAESAPARTPVTPSGSPAEMAPAAGRSAQPTPSMSAATPHSPPPGGRPTELPPPGRGGGHGTGDGGSSGGRPGGKSPPGGGPREPGGGGPSGGRPGGGSSDGGGPHGGGDGGSSDGSAGQHGTPHEGDGATGETPDGIDDSSGPPPPPKKIPGVDYSLPAEDAFRVLGQPGGEIERLLDGGVPRNLIEGYEPLAGRSLEDFKREFTIRGPNGETRWDWDAQAPHNGFAGEPARTDRIPKGLNLDRLGSNSGGFMAPEGIPLQERAMPPGVATQYHRFEGSGAPIPPDKDWVVLHGPAKEAFGQPGGGEQWVVVERESEEPISIDELKRNGMLFEPSDPPSPEEPPDPAESGPPSWGPTQ